MKTIVELINKLDDLVSDIKGGYTPSDFHAAVSDKVRHFLISSGFDLSVWKVHIPYNHNANAVNTPAMFEDFLRYNLDKEDYKNRRFGNGKWKVSKVWFHVPFKYGSVDLSMTIDDYKSFLDDFHAKRIIQEHKNNVRHFEDKLDKAELELVQAMDRLKYYLN